MDSHASGWRSRLFDCASYEDPFTGRNLFFPVFCPQAVCAPCCLVGRTETARVGEPYIDCFPCRTLALGQRGCCLCLATTPLSILTPFPYAPGWVCFAFCQRYQIMKEQSISGGCGELSKACCSPCAMFQHFVQVRESGREFRSSSGVSVPEKGEMYGVYENFDDGPVGGGSGGSGVGLGGAGGSTPTARYESFGDGDTKIVPLLYSDLLNSNSEYRETDQVYGDMWAVGGAPPGRRRDSDEDEKAAGGSSNWSWVPWARSQPEPDQNPLEPQGYDYEDNDSRKRVVTL
eukprot:CAMPEP_0118851878 /NCGR_PEP_ID=MMETSP1163-20130328/1137_1 /TAXON_ID=124430 /ORGANISM="Phaeomonas parva, Strain CCMP2877" /LENGTH=288 /DNA_ID=CAMNT_0006784269 /DNA_START=459 /DNA_END=1325 /DNA_ORIENTATION=+